MRRLGAIRHLLVSVGLVGSMAMAADAPLRFVTEPFAPYTYESKDKQAAGPMVDVLQAVCAQLQRRCLVEVLPWRRAIRMAEHGEVDGVFTVLDSPERRQFFHVSAPVINARYTLFARAGADFRWTGDKQALRGRTLGVYGPSGSSLALDELIDGVPEVSKTLEPDNTTVLRKLAAGRYGPTGLALVNEAVALQLIQSQGLPPLQAVGTVKQFAYGFGLNRTRVSPTLAAQFDGALNQLCSQGRTAALLKPHGLPAAACGSR